MKKSLLVSLFFLLCIVSTGCIKKVFISNCPIGTKEEACFVPEFLGTWNLSVSSDCEGTMDFLWDPEYRGYRVKVAESLKNAVNYQKFRVFNLDGDCFIEAYEEIETETGTKTCRMIFRAVVSKHTLALFTIDINSDLERDMQSQKFIISETTRDFMNNPTIDAETPELRRFLKRYRAYFNTLVCGMTKKEKSTQKVWGEEPEILIIEKEKDRRGGGWILVGGIFFLTAIAGMIAVCFYIK